MSANRARKLLSSCDSNVPQSAKRIQSKVTEQILQEAAEFRPMSGAEHSAESRVPKESSLTPVALFCVFWDKSIIQHLVRVTNAYARRKGATKQQWRYPITVAEFHTFLGITILMGVMPLRPIT